MFLFIVIFFHIRFSFCADLARITKYKSLGIKSIFILLTFSADCRCRKAVYLFYFHILSFFSQQLDVLIKILKKLPFQQCMIFSNYHSRLDDFSFLFFFCSTQYD